jgi:hypothetical protein
MELCSQEMIPRNLNCDSQEHLFLGFTNVPLNIDVPVKFRIEFPRKFSSWMVPPSYNYRYIMIYLPYVLVIRVMFTNLQYPLVNKQFAIENGTVEIVDFPMKNCDFP